MVLYLYIEVGMVLYLYTGNTDVFLFLYSPQTGFFRSAHTPNFKTFGDSRVRGGAVLAVSRWGIEYPLPPVLAPRGLMW